MGTEFNGLGLTDKQKRFCEEYVVDLSAPQAAIRAGCSGRKYNVIGKKLMQNPLVKQYIGELQARRSLELCVSAREVVLELVKIAFADPGNYIDKNGNVNPLDKIPRAYRGAISTYYRRNGEFTIKLHDKIEALKLLGRHLGVFGDETIVKENQLIVIMPKGNPYAQAGNAELGMQNEKVKDEQ